MAERVIGLLEAVPWLRAYAGHTFVVKAGGELLDDPRWLDGLARDVAVLHRLAVRMVVVHGGGPQLDRAAEQAGVGSERVAGRRITTPALIALAVAAWRGTLSAAVVEAVARQGEVAVGLAGYDGGLVTAARRPPAVVTDDGGDRVTVDYGLVGDVTEVKPALIEAVLASGAIPVVTPLAAGERGAVLNVNADTVATELAVALGATKIVFATQVSGIRRDPEDPRSVATRLTADELDALERDGAIRGGMRPKVAAIRRALAGGVPRVHVVDGRQPGALLEEVLTAEGVGTLVVA
jgi:acetylglutamate kinase